MSGRQRLLVGFTTLLAISTVLLYRRASVDGTTGVLQASPDAAEVDYDDPNPVAIERPTASDPLPASTSTNFTVRLVVGGLAQQDTSWLSAEAPGFPALVYVADDPSAPHHPPANKGNEAMAYLSYIIEHYDVLADVSVFVHPHRYAWHNNDLLDNDMAEMLRHLRMEQVVAEGYMNLRCQWGPGCPHWLHPRAGAIGATMSKQEQAQISRVWRELFPLEPLPEGLSAPCCAQFAASRGAIRRLPLQQYVAMRDWVMRTELSDYIVGRCFEYLWQYIFTGREEVCPDQHVCHCKGYGLCFESDAVFQKWFEIRQNAIKKQEELNALAGDEEEGANRLRLEVEAMQSDLAERKGVALGRGRAGVEG